MKIAAGIIGLLLGLLVLLQSCTVATTASLGGNAAIGEAGSVGIIVALLFFIGGAFAFGLPIVSVVVFALAAALAFLVSGEFGDMATWGGAGIILAVLSFFGRRSDKKAKAARGATS